MTAFTNYETVAAFLAANSAPHFRSSTVMRELITVEAPTAGSNSKKFVTMGNLAMSVVAEGADATESTYDESSITLTLQKGKVYTTITHEAETYTAGDKLSQLAQESGVAAAEKYDTDALALAAGFSQTRGATGAPLTVAALKEAAYVVRLSKSSAPIVAVLHESQVHDLQDNIITSQASVFDNGGNQEVTDSQPSANGFRGRVFNLPIYGTMNVSDDGTDYSGLVMNRYALASLLKPAFTVDMDGDVKASVKELGLIMDYALGEWKDNCACRVVSGV